MFMWSPSLFTSCLLNLCLVFDFSFLVVEPSKFDVIGLAYYCIHDPSFLFKLGS